MGMACPDYLAHNYSARSHCPWCGSRLHNAHTRPAKPKPAWPPDSYGTRPGFFRSLWPKTDEERWEQARIELCWLPWPIDPPITLPAPQAQIFKSPLLRRLRYVVVPMAR